MMQREAKRRQKGVRFCFRWSRLDYSRFPLFHFVSFRKEKRGQVLFLMVPVPFGFHSHIFELRPRGFGGASALRAS
jgi:hypothetical protein